MTQDHDDPNKDEVQDTTTDPHLGGKVERVLRRGADGERHERVKVSVKRTHRYRALDGEGEVEADEYHKVAEFEPQVATEVLFALAHAHGYRLEAK